MSKVVAIKIMKVEKILIEESVWENSFGESLPLDLDDIEMLKDECITSYEEFAYAEASDPFEYKNK